MTRRSERLRDRTIFRLVNDVCAEAHDATVWPYLLCERLSDLLAARVVNLAWARLPETPGGFNSGEVQIYHGFTREQLRVWNNAYWRPGNRFASECLRRIVNIRARFVTVRRQDVMDDTEWYAQEDVQRVHRVCNIDANMASFFVASSMRRLFGIGIHRDWGEPQFTARDRQCLRLAHLELARAWRERMAKPREGDHTIDMLPQRLRQVLWMLCLGRSEKQIAETLELSRHTVHNHVTRLHKLLNVNSRGELLARCLTPRAIAPVNIPGEGANDFRPPE